MLRWRVISGTTVVALLCIICWVDFHFNFRRPGLWLLPLGMLICFLATAEFASLVSASGIRVPVWIACLGVFLLMMCPILPILKHGYQAGLHEFRLEWSLHGLWVAFVLTLCRGMKEFREPGSAVLSIGLTLLAMVYVGMLGCFLTGLRTFQGNERGMLAIVSMIAVVKSSDTGAYAFGHLFGRRRLAPLLSPGKTIEGACGGCLSGCLASGLMFNIAAPLLVPEHHVVPLLNWMAYGLILSLAGLLGDLSESLMKRDFQKKDSSTWLPGLGGVLDMMDSVILAAPVAYLFWYFGLLTH
ncbi:MAG: hypothetical protein CMJ81_14950 [Planctomycetaceae bacterium]|nr:hypothetical protein [Planctomycetaceae bacterium]